MKYRRLLTDKLSRSLGKIVRSQTCPSCLMRTYSSIKSDHVRVRFAPSPTGDLHLGGLRTAFYNYLFAKQNSGTFILRCEDTDQVRLVPGAMERMIDMLDWMGMRPDEGPLVGGDYGPYIQSQRLELYHQWTDYLLSEGHAYRCFCSPLRLELLRKEQARNREGHQGYDNCCRTLSGNKIKENTEKKLPYVIRFKLNNDDVRWTDLVYGDMATDTSYTEGDPVILKSDGYPTYHLANVIDDHLMDITHVLRGAEWQTSTFKHLQLFNAFGWKAPNYAHLPLLMNSDGTKLSKRQDAMQIKYLKDCGYEPESLIALLSISGGGVRIPHTKINENGVTMQEAIDQFSMEHIQTQNTSLAVDRLNSLNNTSIFRKYNTDDKQTFCDSILSLEKLKESTLTREQQESAVHRLYHMFPKYSDRIHLLNDFVDGESFSFIWTQPPHEAFSALQNEKYLTVDKTSSMLKSIILHLQTHDISETTVDDLSKVAGVKKKPFFTTIRLVLVGKESGVPMVMMLDLLDKEEIILRCQKALNYITTDTSHNSDLTV